MISITCLFWWGYRSAILQIASLNVSISSSDHPMRIKMVVPLIKIRHWANYSLKFEMIITMKLVPQNVAYMDNQAKVCSHDTELKWGFSSFTFNGLYTSWHRLSRWFAICRLSIIFPTSLHMWQWLLCYTFKQWCSYGGPRWPVPHQVCIHVVPHHTATSAP